MRINSMKLTIIIIELMIISGIIIGLFFLEIPEQNGKAFMLVLGSLISEMIHSINNMFQRQKKSDC